MLPLPMKALRAILLFTVVTLPLAAASQTFPDAKDLPVCREMPVAFNQE